MLQLLGYGGSGGGIGGSGISFFDVVLGVIGWKWLQSKFPNNVPFDGTSPVNVSNTSEAQAAAETGAEGSAAESTSVESAIEQLMEGE